MLSRDEQRLVSRAEMALIGALAGAAMWVLIEYARDVLVSAHLFVTVASGVAGFFAVLLALSCPATVRRAALGAVILTVPAAVLLGLSSLRYDTLGEFAEAAHLVFAWGAMLFIGTPFLAVWLEDRRGVHNYEMLFDAAWSIVVRYSAAWLFVGVVWAVVFLSDALLQIVGATVIDDVLDIPVVPHVLSGVALGLGLAVVHEMRDYVSPYLLLRLLRLLVPVMLLVVGVFVSAAALRGTGAMFDELSVAATLLAVALGVISLVSVALDKCDEDAVTISWMRWATGALALLLPALAGLAGYAVWLRVAQYGWTPPRLMASTITGVVGVYAVTYAVSVLLRGRWMEHIRQANIVIAGGILLLSAVWMTPVLNVEAISARSQMARIVNGNVAPEDAALWEFANRWGRPGKAVLADLEARDDTSAELVAAIEKARSQANSVYQAPVTETQSELSAELRAMIRVLPDEAALSVAMLSGLPDYRVLEWYGLCGRSREPGCVLVLDDFDVSRAGLEGVMFLPGEGQGYDVMSMWVESGMLSAGLYVQELGQSGVTRGDVERVLRGDFRVAPSSRKALWIGDLELFPEN
ncbi:DUF4153 domain-containing protein [Shimia abyssi]|uniref:Uncharacterized protein DUF4153 n=1 Tax=Shimia abyssi TaxID=1662395 RepID=A0A2P8FD61_9RHOB|nr:DUF4153 domain-containing protein [Shimia abyssi]PSL19651.1 uncharacterized protein DUF4153 [Shimia abyssi]